MDNFYFCNPEKNTDCTKESCYINGGPCKLTSKEECKKPTTNQDRIAEMVRTMDAERLAEILEPEFACDVDCPCAEDCKKHPGEICSVIIWKWLQKEE